MKQQTISRKYNPVGRRINTYWPVVLASLLAVSCEKVIDLPLKGTTPQLVIEATMATDSVCRVRISRTLDFAEPNEFPAVSDAAVTLSDDAGNRETLRLVSDGLFESSADGIKGVEGRTYSLSVDLDGNRYEATSRMPRTVVLDSISTMIMPWFGGGKRVYISPNFQDPAGEENYYKFNFYLNGKKEKRVYIWGDDFSNGNYIRQMPFVNEDEIEKGDTVRVEMQCIDPAVYMYFYTLEQGQENAATPANPISNFTGGCLGYFSAHTSSTRTIIVEVSAK